MRKYPQSIMVVVSEYVIRGTGYYLIAEIMTIIDLMHNDVTRLDAREECWS
jgi:hypothetical protein